MHTILQAKTSSSNESKIGCEKENLSTKPVQKIVLELFNKSQNGMGEYLEEFRNHLHNRTFLDEKVDTFK